MTLSNERFYFHQTLNTLAIYILHESFVNSDAHLLSFISYDNSVLKLFYFIDASGRTWRLKIRFWNSVSRGEPHVNVARSGFSSGAAVQFMQSLSCTGPSIFNRCQIVILFGLFILSLSF